MGRLEPDYIWAEVEMVIKVGVVQLRAQILQPTKRPFKGLASGVDGRFRPFLFSFVKDK
jgi:hypothetical protein